VPDRAPYDVVRCPAGVVKDQPDIVRCPADFTRIFTCNNDYIYIKMHHYSLKETGCSKKKDSDWLWQWLWWKPHLLKTAKISIALIRCMLIILSCSSEIYYLYLSFWSKGMKYLWRCAQYWRQMLNSTTSVTKNLINSLIFITS